MNPSFPRLLRQFMRSVDIVDPALETAVLNHLGEYLDGDENVAYAEVMQRVPSSESELALSSLWRTHLGERMNAQLIASASEEQLRTGACTNALSAVDQNRPRWIVDPDGGDLGEGAVDLWATDGQESSIGSYRPPTGETNEPLPFRTSIIHPLVYNGEVIGALDLESTNHLEPVNAARDEVRILADALGTLLGMRVSGEYPKRLRGNALSAMRKEAAFTEGLALTRPKLFFAWPAEARRDEHCAAVVASIREVLGEYAVKLDVIDWEETAQLGVILDQITSGIRSAAYGLCYFSEPASDRPDLYVDNPNVLFEAGMLHALVGDRQGWIPIREEDERCEDPPFDLNPLRRIQVPRTEEGVLDTERLKELLRTTIDDMAIAD